MPRQVIQCGAFAAELISREGEAGVWLVTQGALRVHTSAPSSSADSPFTADCRRAVLVEPAGQLAVYELPERQPRWPAPSLLIDLPKEKGRVCEVALLRWQNPKRLSLIVGCSGWHGVVPAVIDLADPTHWLIDGPAICRLEQRKNCELEEFKPFDWKR